jgi:hypothetical protein
MQNNKKIVKDLIRVYVACRVWRYVNQDLIYWMLDDTDVAGYRYNRKTNRMLDRLAFQIPRMSHKETVTLLSEVIIDFGGLDDLEMVDEKKLDERARPIRSA